MALLSRELGRIDINAPIEKELEEFKVREWDNEKVLEIFRNLRFNRYIERFHLEQNQNNIQEEKDIKKIIYY